ncbi:hypothetical protein ACIHCQ_32350 [Streptomyces sp. NPDC052236]|uniref:hypothetical protein n=1 Tax=Streptomyces sp. NPDC052236 TaxID=3365686 RepID=UPI0037D5AA61
MEHQGQVAAGGDDAFEEAEQVVGVGRGEKALRGEGGGLGAEADVRMRGYLC